MIACLAMNLPLKNHAKPLCIILIATSQHSVSTVTPFSKPKTCIIWSPCILAISLVLTSHPNFSLLAVHGPRALYSIQPFLIPSLDIQRPGKSPDSRLPGLHARIFGSSVTVSIFTPLLLPRLFKAFDTFASRAVLIRRYLTVATRRRFGAQSLPSLLPPPPSFLSMSSIFVCLTAVFFRLSPSFVSFPHLSTLSFSAGKSVFLCRVVSYLS